MKKLIIILIITIGFYSCKAQSIILPLGSSDYENNPNYYLKDIDNELDKFVGVWKYQLGDEQIIIELRKEIHYLPDNNNCYEDLLVGEYKYIDANGNVIVDTLDVFNDITIKGYEHNIVGNFLYFNDGWIIKLAINHPTDQWATGDLKINYFDNIVDERISLKVVDHTTMGDTNIKIDIPNGTYELIKE